ncbi:MULTISPECIES: DUF805 domain-containing protein [Photobacterium]|uniref:Inner membrane protein n=1 Tax=Photobacterium ganghwense TaxID=320778 RepID=A0A0J1KAM1_9GAMM|nr:MULTISPECIES: DUF805 domain-containing protein [Photobacterium]KLV11367.1 inner membrane protein [Photobacterium ganghwense]MBV1840609.1 DUF805 domain-containing protein [Photobacterium ganghwense]PSU08219.1 DUF805 domain-containing protein [Photobacterium ganghwense]QSV15025.1 DUF805 domain-containing protein [Photobacterium ganghwense]
MNQKWALFSFKGRMRRRDYWLYSIPVLLMIMPVFFYTSPENFSQNPLLETLSLVIMGFVTWASTALNVKRLHDRNKSAWWIILTFLPVIGPIFVIIELGILDGTAGPNQYGPDPKGRGAPPSSGTPSSGQPSDKAEKDSVTIEM